MVRIQFAIDLQYELTFSGADFVFNIHAAKTAAQTVLSEQLQISQTVLTTIQTDPSTYASYLRLTANAGPLHMSATRLRWTSSTTSATRTRSRKLRFPCSPLSALTYIYPSRYCQSDRLGTLAAKVFGEMPKGYRRVEAIQNWVRSQVTFKGNTSNSATSALDTLTDRVGVCRDFRPFDDRHLPRLEHSGALYHRH
jgi:transglutaminase-like putative cysteine protease